MKWKNSLITFGLIAGLTILIHPANAQPYQSLFSKGDYTTKWTTTWFNLNVAGIAEAYVQKDTLVNGMHYKKVIYSGLEDLGYLFREDTIQGIVWTRTAHKGPYFPVQYPIGWEPDTTDRIAFRFDLNVGDTFDISYFRMQKGSYPDSLNIVDSIRIIDGRKHIYFRGKYFRGKTSWEPITLIEGVGSNLGIFMKVHNDPLREAYVHLLGERLIGAYLLCHYKDGERSSYRNRLYDGECEPYLNIQDFQSYPNGNPEISFYPNPARDKVWVENPTEILIQSIQVYNAFGTRVRVINGEGLKSFDAEGLPPGVYCIRLFSDNGYQCSKPLVIH